MIFPSAVAPKRVHAAAFFVGLGAFAIWFALPDAASAALRDASASYAPNVCKETYRYPACSAPVVSVFDFGASCDAIETREGARGSDDFTAFAKALA